MTSKYYDCWNEKSDIDYDEVQSMSEEAIIYAGYTYEHYSGSALVVFVKDGQLYENNDSHCSCYGLEDWAPELTTKDALMIREYWPGLQEALEAMKVPESNLAVAADVMPSRAESINA